MLLAHSASEVIEEAAKSQAAAGLKVAKSGRVVAREAPQSVFGHRS